MAIPEIDKKLGMETYITTSPGIGGAIKRAVEDFIVQEVLVDGSVANVGKMTAKPALGATHQEQTFLLCMLVKRRWDTLIALKRIARTLGINQGRLQIAGIKDAKAITSQYITIEGIAAKQATRVHINDMQLVPVGYFHEPLSSYYLLGNEFRIKIREISHSESLIEDRVAAIARELTLIGGIPNFYGHQRFGTTRAITHLVGRALAKGDVEQAAMLFLAEPSPNEHPESNQTRNELKATHNFRQALRVFPRQLRFERVMLSHLAEKPTDYYGAFHRLPLKLQLLFVQAYQSFLFNRFLSARIKEGFLLSRAEVGDFVVNVERSGLPMVSTGRWAESVKLDTINDLIREGKLRIALPLIGLKQKLSGGEMGKLQLEILEQEGFNSESFSNPLTPKMLVRGQLRAAVSPVNRFIERIEESEAESDQMGVEFMLLRGSYATILLREIIKPEDPVSSGF